MLPKEFLYLEWGEFWMLCEHKFNQEENRNYEVASLMAAIYNTIPRKKGSKMSKPEDFLQKQVHSDVVNTKKRGRDALKRAKEFDKKGKIIQMWQ